MDKNDKTEGLLGGFKPILGAFSNDFEGMDSPFDADSVEDLTDEEIEALKGKGAPPVPPVKEGKENDIDEEDDDEEEEVETPKKKGSK
ncbi:MAG: hypothetical protein ABFD07_11060, partial [Methanobacterium sp.]